MLKKATEKGLITEGATIIEPTSGNTGIGLAAACVSMGYKAILVMPDTMSVERQQLLKAYGAEIVLTDGAKGMLGSIEKATELHQSTPNSFIPSQFENPDNPESHITSTGVEIYRDTEGRVDIFVACIGTGGSVIASCLAFAGAEAMAAVARYNADICFFACRGLSDDGRLTDISEAENGVRQEMLRHAAKSYMLCTRERLGKVFYHNLC